MKSNLVEKGYMREYMTKKRENAQFKTIETIARKLRRQNIEVKTNENKRNTTARKVKRQNPEVQERERKWIKLLERHKDKMLKCKKEKAK